MKLRWRRWSFVGELGNQEELQILFLSTPGSLWPWRNRRPSQRTSRFGFGVLTCIFVVFWEHIHRICRALVDSCCLKHLETPSAAWGLWTFAGRAGGELLAGTEPKKAGHLAKLDCIRVRPRAKSPKSPKSPKSFRVNVSSKSKACIEWFW